MSKGTSVSQVAYVGPAVEVGSMDVRELAPALLAVGQLCEEANRIINGDRATLTVHVQSKFERGSFQLFLELQQTLAQQISLLVSRENIATAADIAELIGFLKPGLMLGVGGVSLFALLRRLRGRVPSQVASAPNNHVELHFTGDNQTITVSNTVYQLAADPVLRAAAAAVVKPVTHPGITAFEAREGEDVIEHVNREDAEAIASIPPATLGETPATDVTPERIVLLQVVKASFESGLTWSFSDGASRFGAYLKDERFMEEVLAGRKNFAKGDMLRVRLKTRTFVSDQGLRAEHDVVEVIEEVPAPRQPRLLPQLPPNS